MTKVDPVALWLALVRCHALSRGHGVVSWEGPRSWFTGRKNAAHPGLAIRRVTCR